MFREMSTVEVRDNFEKAVKKFLKDVERTGILSELRRRRCFEKPSSIRRRKRLEAVKREMRKRKSEGRR